MRCTQIEQSRDFHQAPGFVDQCSLLAGAFGNLANRRAQVLHFDFLRVATAIEVEAQATARNAAMYDGAMPTCGALGNMYVPFMMKPVALQRAKLLRLYCGEAT